MPGDAEPPTPRQRRHRRELLQARADSLLQGVASMLRPGDVVVDGGAHWGDVTERLAATGATVHAFEPDPVNFARLQARFAGVATVHLHAAALGVAAGMGRLSRLAGWQDDPRRALAKSTLMDGHPQMAGAERVEVPVIDLLVFLDGLMAERGEVAVLKLDIEGAELAILEEMLTRRLFDRIRLTLAETHERLFPALQPRYAALRAAVADTWPATRVNLDWI
jgi:FkbM family methyltransferase